MLQASATARVLIAGQAPGRKVHESGVPWDDASGKRLRQWLGIGPETFYDSGKVALVPMGFCFPGSAKSGDLPPRPECARTWHHQLLPLLQQVRIKIVLGQYALRYHLPELAGRPLSEVVATWREWPADVVVLPHPSPRNQGWFKAHPWFESEVVPLLRTRVESLLGTNSAPI